jgi:precorrin-4 methylase/DMSO/TMAO reductase YedYZ molybdopterin-dependent catalytic subunit
MQKKILLLSLSIFVLLFPIKGSPADSPTVSITGVVKQPLNLTMEDLSRFETVCVRLNEITRDKIYHGAVNYSGVPLKTLLEVANIQKEETDFSKLIDLAVVVRNREGKETVLSWGELFYRNPAETIIAFSATPIMPMRKCQDCHAPEVYQKWLEPLRRQIDLPKLVIANDFYTDRSLEGIVNIEVRDLHPKMVSKKLPELFSPQFSVTGAVGEALNIADISSYTRREVTDKQIGDGRGYHGLRNFQGVSLLELIEKAGVGADLNAVLLVSAPDGYRSLVSLGELLLNQSGGNIVIADQVDGVPLKKNGRFSLIIPDDLSADRMVKAVDKIEVITLAQKPKLYIIGVGCADTSLITLEAISYMGKADVFLCSEDIQKRFAKYMGSKPILFDPLLNTERMFREKNPNLSPEESKRLLEEKRSNDIQKIRDALSNGKNVAFLEYGDPTLYGSWIYWLKEFQDAIEIVPGISAFNAANATIGKHFGCNGSIVLTVPQGLKSNEAMLKAVAENGDTLVIFIGLKEMKDLMPLFEKYYPSSTPVNLVYRAGYSDSERLIKSTLSEVLSVEEGEKETHLGMIYIGPCLK